MRLAGGITNGRVRVRYNYARYGYTRGGGKTWHGGIDLELLDDIVQIQNEYKIKATTRVVEVVISDSSTGTTIVPTFSTPTLTKT